MVTDATSLTGNGLRDWLIQRASALYLTFYTLYLFGFIFLHPHVGFAEWQALFHCVVFKIASLLALFLLSLHSWVGIWTVTTDYIKCTGLRLAVQALVMLWLFGQFIWGLLIIWGQ